MNFNIFNAKTLKELNDKYYTSFLSSFTFDNYKETNEIPFSLIRPEYNDISELLNYNEEDTNNFYYNSPIAIILNYVSNSLYDHYSFDLIYNSNKNEFLTFDTDEYERIVS